MALQGNTTLYLLAGTCIDMDNTIWMSRFAYHAGEVYQNEPGKDWSAQLFQWFKAHSISRGYWYMTTVSPGKGYVDVGRQQLVQDLAIKYSQEGLGSDYINSFLDNPNFEYYLGMPMIDYMVWSNDFGNPNFYGAFVDRIEAINMATVRVFFTIDAIISYQTFFYFGPSWIEREHCYQDWTSPDRSEYLIPNWKNIGTEGEPFQPSENDMVFEEIPSANGTFTDLEDFGNYDTTFVMSDIDLTSLDYIKPREDYPAFAQFSPAQPTEVRATHKREGESTELVQTLSIGVYLIPSWDNAVFKELGKYNAFEHILYTYTVPHKFVEPYPHSGLPKQPTQYIRDYLIGGSSVTGDYTYDLELPIVLRDDGSNINDQQGTKDYQAYKPMNAKCYYAPYCYISVTDCMGSSMEWIPQLTDGITPQRHGSVRFEFGVEQTTLPNVASSLYCANYKKVTGGKYSPMYTVWQMPAYSMTPNASGYGEMLRNACMQRGLMYERVATAVPYLAAGGAIDASTQGAASMLELVGSGLGYYLGSTPIGGVTLGGGTGANFGNQAAKVITNPGRALGSAFSNMFSSFGGGVLGGGVTAANGEASNKAGAYYDSMFGLPKAVGGLPNGTTVTNLKQVGYKFFFAHVNVYTLRRIDSYFSMYGYACNQWKFPNINTRRRWNYVKTRVCNLDPVNDAYDATHGFLIPTWAREQIIQRMNSGVTFWNLRWKMYGEVDESNKHDQWYDWNTFPSDMLFGRFVGNYGDRPDSQEMKDNQSIVGGYCDGFYDPYIQIV